MYISQPLFAKENEATSKRITGAFTQLDGGNMEYTEQQWRQELESMKKLGMDTLIIDGVAAVDHAFCRINKYPIWPNCGTDDPLKTILTISEELGIKVFIGLYRQNWKDSSEDALKVFAKLCNDIADEVWVKYGKCKAFAGWYCLNWEISNVIPPVHYYITTYLEVTNHLKKLSPKLPVLISPFFSLAIKPSDMEKGWCKILPVLKPDIVALQDGIGCDRQLTPENVGPYFEALSKACEKCKVEFWGNVETFNMLPNWSTAPADRVLKQIKAVSPYSSKIITWEFNHYISPVRPREGQKELFEALLAMTKN